MERIKHYILHNMRVVLVIICFFVTLYIQHVESMAKLKELDHRYNTLETKLEDQYQKIDAIKLDKSVFEATMVQVTAMREDVKEIRSDIKEILRDR